MVRTIILVLGLTSAISLAATTRADDLIAEQFYGSGVHSYFSGNVQAAYDDFTTAIGAGTDDPRPYYYRALTYLRMGRSADAAADFRKGADLEAADINASYQVSKALERVQGPSRTQLERYRVRARAIAQQRQDEQRRERYAAARRMEMQRVQRAGAQEDVVPREAAERRGPDPFEDAGATPMPPGPSRNPFDAREPPAEAAPPRRPPPANAITPPGSRSPAADAGNPFGAPPAEAEKPAEDAARPFGAPPPAAERPLDAGANPFGGTTTIERTTTERATAAPPAVDSSPFGAPAGPARNSTPPAAAPPSDSSPFGAPAESGARETPPAAADDSSANPFGAPASSAPAASSPPANPAAADSNPFGAPAAAAAPPPPGDGAAANPFGAPPAAADSGTATASPFGAPATNPPTPAANAGATKGGAGTGLFRALRRATGIDGAVDLVGGAAKSLPHGSGSQSATAGSAPFGAPPGAPTMRAAPIQGDNPFGAPPAAAGPATAAPPAASDDNPFGPPDAAPGAPAGSPFGAPPADMTKKLPADSDNPFRDDPGQPAAKDANPFGGSR